MFVVNKFPNPLLKECAIVNRSFWRAQLSTEHVRCSMDLKSSRQFAMNETKEKTFSRQKSLPSLPLPNLSSTIHKYVQSASCVLSPERLQATVRRAEQFERSTEATLLQEKLMQRAKENRNWLKDWWYDAYNETRHPLSLQNMGGIVPKARAIQGRQLHRAAQMTRAIMEYWLKIRREEIPITVSRGTAWDMNQYYNLFNAVRKPSVPKDRLGRYFKTEDEGTCPSHIIVLCHRRVYKVEMMRSGELITPDELYINLKTIYDVGEDDKHESPIALTSADRDTWSYNREQLIFHSPQNVNSLRQIEQAVFALSLSSESYSCNSDLLFSSLFGNPYSQWFDKNFTLVVMEDGQITLNADHCNVDAICLFSPLDEAANHIDDNWIPKETALATVPTQLGFDLTPLITDSIRRAEKSFYNVGNNVDLQVLKYEGLGKTFMRETGLHLDAVIQIAIQLAYWRTHETFAPAYETASTRQFYHGRTETCRSLTPQLVNFIQALTQTQSDQLHKTLFYQAYTAHNDTMNMAREGQGIDRHLFGLRKVGSELGSKDHPIHFNGLFQEQAWKEAGGDGNFKLSTSFLGFTPNGTFGYVVAMCEDGYGCFYKANDNSVIFSTTCFKNEKVSLSGFLTNLRSSLDMMTEKIRKWTKQNPQCESKL